uniref:Uncharacterized protein n=1 Tax=Odontella aurita TaxID=265563 RepID=A0A7S4J961_9STRA|mmetsp:Transcript_418/g.1250  ORF Transcript_418/g.1250 Transcript_418/m.1250 type:complete len:225 (+) Transcript_418:1236-1910(+)
MRRVMRASDPCPTKDRDKILRKLGLSEDDVRISEMLLAQMPPAPAIGESTKAEWLLGYAEPRLRRQKALKILGVSEEELEVENSKNLGSLGVGGRRRSFSGVTHGSHAIIIVPASRRKSSRPRRGRRLTSIRRPRPRRELRRHSTGSSRSLGSRAGGSGGLSSRSLDSDGVDEHGAGYTIPTVEEMKAFRRQARRTQSEIRRLKSRIGVLEEKLEQASRGYSSS